MQATPGPLDEFLQKVDPLMQPPPLYQSLEFACVAIRQAAEWVVVSGKAFLTTEAPPPDASTAPRVNLDRLIALSWRTKAESINHLIAHLREGWVVEVPQLERIRLSASGVGAYSWQGPAVCGPDRSRTPSTPWRRVFALYGRGPEFSGVLNYSTWEEIERHLRKRGIASGFDALCEKLGLAARRDNLPSTFYLGAELPARFTNVQADFPRSTLEINFECVDRPELTIDWLPQHEFKTIPLEWQRGSEAGVRHASVPLHDRAEKAELKLYFADIEAADTFTLELKHKEVRGPAPSPPKRSSLLYGRWKSLRSLPEGGQAHVFVVEDSNGEFTGRLALKRLKNIDDPHRRKRFEDEVAAVRSVNHPNVLKVKHSDVATEQPYFVAEYCERGSLQNVGTSRYKRDIVATMETMLPILDALVAVHKAGVFHRDVKPANILIRGDGTPVIGDFGICFMEGGQHFTLSNEGVGSRNFIAPEMESGQHDLGEPSDRTDVYSLGKVIYWMLSGGNEFAREDYPSLVDLFEDQRFRHVHDLLEHMIARDPERRMHSHEVKQKLASTAALVAGNAAWLAPSIGIKCRFCGIGTYQRAPTYKDRNSYSYFGLPEAEQAADKPGGETAVLRCDHCGHIEWFQLKDIACRGWWER
jgi:tRNA A-37 threonylcarbamoyl transferase component Bud32